jgi:hypothetical protein
MAGGLRIVLDGVDRYRVVDPMFEGVRIVLSCRGETYSPAYIQGISGAAFRIGGICPCAPTCDRAMEPAELVSLLGYQATHIPLHQLSEDGSQAVDPERADQVIAQVKEEIRAGRAALVWHAFSFCEWNVVAGFDDEKHLFLGRSPRPTGGGYAEADQRRTITCQEVCPALGVILVGEKVGELDRQSAEINALREAVRHAHSTEGQDRLEGDEWVMLHGLLCYDRWVDDWRSLEKELTLGDMYCEGVYRGTHRAAAGFLRGIAAKYSQAEHHLERAAEAFVTEADALDGAAPLIGWGAPAGPDAERNARVVPLLQRARDAYARAIDEIEGSLAVLGLTP